MTQWGNIQSNIFTVTGIEGRSNADKLFVSLLKEIERRGIDIRKTFTIGEIANLIPRGTAGVTNNSVYGFSMMSMLSNQRNRDYFIFNNKSLAGEFTKLCNNNHRDNYYWKKNYLNEYLHIDPKYIIANTSYDITTEEMVSEICEATTGKLC